MVLGAALDGAYKTTQPILGKAKGATDGQRSCKEGKDDKREYKGGVVIVLAAYTTRHQKHSVEGEGTELGAT